MALKCSPETEARVFEAFEPPPEIDAQSVACPVAVAVGGVADLFHDRLQPMARGLAAALPHAKSIQ